jgi:hypothetical protein
VNNGVGGGAGVYSIRNEALGWEEEEREEVELELEPPLWKKVKETTTGRGSACPAIVSSEPLVDRKSVSRLQAQSRARQSADRVRAGLRGSRRDRSFAGRGPSLPCRSFVSSW